MTQLPPVTTPAVFSLFIAGPILKLCLVVWCARLNMTIHRNFLKISFCNFCKIMVDYHFYTFIIIPNIKVITMKSTAFINIFSWSIFPFSSLFGLILTYDRYYAARAWITTIYYIFVLKLHLIVSIIILKLYLIFLLLPSYYHGWLQKKLLQRGLLYTIFIHIYSWWYLKLT